MSTKSCLNSVRITPRLCEGFIELADMEDDMSIDDFKRWKVESLKDFIRQRGLNVTGCKETLVARAYVAWEMKLDKVPTAAQYGESVKKDYNSLLQAGGETVPDPLKLQGWLSEKESIQLWPPTMVQDIGVYLARLEPFRKEGPTFTQRLLSDYKDQKAYSYFSSAWLLDIQYHKISDSSKFCFLKASCTPSQKIRHTPHNVWVLLEKKTGVIWSAFCSCFAGIGQSCNHMAALLFKVDFCWQHGYIQKAVTSQPCVWKEGGKSVLIEPKMVKDMKIVKPKAERPAPATSFHTDRKSSFMPHQNSKGMSFKDFSASLSKIHPSAVMLGESSTERYPLYVDWDRSVHRGEVPRLPTIAERMAQEGTIPTLLPGEVLEIERATRGQADNIEWIRQRKGICTASIFKTICTRQDTMEKTPDADPSRLVNCILGKIEVPDVAALKYGRRMEPLAAQKYAAVQKRKHRALKLQECGLFVDGDHPYIGASPDRIVTCCCGEGVLEVKCPMTCASAAPTSANVPYLCNTDGVVSIDTKHQYFYQIQGQMALTNTKWCDFFVFSHQGYYLERVLFDQDFWTGVKGKLRRFWLACVLPSLAAEAPEVAHEEIVTTSTTVTDAEMHGSASSPQPPTTVTDAEMHGSASSPQPPKRKKKKKIPVFTCGKCYKRCLEPDDIELSAENSIQCDKCHSWWHWGCVNIKDEEDEDLGMDWYCANCIQKKAKKREK